VFLNRILIQDPVRSKGGRSNSEGNEEFTHFRGLNIQSLIIDNIDGEVLALTKNGILEEESPLIHAEQRAIHSANLRLQSKRPRRSGRSGLHSIS
jgi:tRNA(Arg) A34 adenosine deaminase TadA